VSRLIDRAKDAVLEKMVLRVLRPKAERYGEIRKFALNTSTRQIRAEISLRGDALPLIISEAQYRIEQRQGQTRLILHSVKVSREWLQNLLDDHFREIPIKIPDYVRLLA
jgi:hypothetical protein